LQTLNDITRIINVVIALALIVKMIMVLRCSSSHRLARIFPAIIAMEVIAFAVLQFSGGVDPLLLNWLSQLIRLETLLYFLVT
jgi:hypothetical protein